MLIKSWHQPKRESLVSKSPGAYSSYSHSSSLYSNTFHINSLSYPFNYYYYYYSVLRHPSCLYSKASNQKDSSGVKPTSLPTPPSDNTLQRVFSLLFLDLLLLLPTLHLDPCPSRTRLTLDCIAPPHVCCVSNARLYHCTSLAKVPSPPPSFLPSFLSSSSGKPSTLPPLPLLRLPLQSSTSATAYFDILDINITFPTLFSSTNLEALLGLQLSSIYFPSTFLKPTTKHKQSTLQSTLQHDDSYSHGFPDTSAICVFGRS